MLTDQTVNNDIADRVTFDGHFNIRILKHTYSHSDSKIFGKMKFVLHIQQIIFAGQHFESELFSKQPMN